MGRRLTDELSLKPRRFSDPIKLALDDYVPTSMVLIIVYPFHIEPSLLATAFGSGLDVFPHLTGAIGGSVSPFELEIRPADAALCLELVQSARRTSLADIESMSVDEHFAEFAPACVREGVQFGEQEGLPLFAARLTSLNATEMSVLGLVVSHMAVDGIGLSYFLSHSVSALSGTRLRRVVHERRVLRVSDPGGALEIPYRYVSAKSDHKSGMREWDAARQYPLSIFTVPIQAAMSFLGSASLSAVRFGLTAFLCRELAQLNPDYMEVGLWCNPRGTNGIPKSYTGNVGCYLHLPLREGSTSDLAHQLRSIASREGFTRIADTYRRLKQAEMRGFCPTWDGLAPEVLPVNLVSYSPSSAGVAAAAPSMARMLTRNLHGLRLSITPNRQQFLVEVCLPRDLSQALTDRCQRHGLIAFQQGSDSLDR